MTIWLVLSVGLLLRSLCALHPYSGESTPPRFGDYEAQRHFMEITVNLPTSEWYRVDSDYWPLDYPPLTAYHSWMIGKMSNAVNSSWLAWNASRGVEDYSHRIFMRHSVLVSDLLVFVLAAVCFTKYSTLISSKKEGLNLLIVLLSYPGFILIDHGHFQYNCVMLGLVLWSVLCLTLKHSRYLLASVLFSLALLFKQMALYYSLAYFSFLLGFSLFNSQLTPSKRIWRLIQIASVVLLTFSLAFYPFYHLDGVDGVVRVLKRLFPFQRGLFEDKVANFWCALSLIVKLKQFASQDSVILSSALTTLVACFPVCIALIRRPEKQRFVYGLSSVSLSFFLFSYHVHEKSILLPALPILLLYGKEPTLVHWFVNVSVFSMYPLMKKDNLQLAYVAMLIFWHAVHSVPQQWSWLHSIRNPYARFIIKSSMFGMIAIHLADALITPPAKLPDIFTMMNVVLSAGVFLIINAYLIWKTLSLSSKQKSE